MKRFFYSCILILIGGVFGLSAQNSYPERSTIFDALEQSSPGKGEVIINQPPAIASMVGKRLHGANIEKGDNVTYIKVQGYRVQVFSGNNQRNSKNEAFNKEKEINSNFPDIPTYVTYNAPFWRLRVGDYGSQEQAYRMLRQLTDAFPSFGKEMYIVKEEVKIPLQQEEWDY